MSASDKTAHTEPGPITADSTSVDGAVWRMIGDPPTVPPRDFDPSDGTERYGAGVCVTGTCVEPCGLNGGCSR